MGNLLEVCGLTREFSGGEPPVHVLNGVDLEVAAGTLMVIAGPSGSGKSTLLHLMGGLDRPTSGSVFLEGRDLALLSEVQLTLLRRRRIGFVFQFFNLLPNMPTWQNIAMPLLLDEIDPRLARQRAIQIVEELGLGAMAEREAGRLSGGEMQRVAIARDLIADPVLVLADEPTGNLDSTTGRAVLGLLSAGVRRRNRTLVMVTHDPSAVPRAVRVVRLLDGRIADG